MRVMPVAGTVTLLLALPSAATAHDGGPPADVVFQTRFTLVLLALGAAVYVRAVRRRHGRWPWHRNLAAAGGALAITGALLPPLGRLAVDTLTAHMVQHTMLILVAAPLLAAARPIAVLSTALPPLRVSRRLLPAAGVACLLHAAALWIWHLPGPYDLTLRSAPAHALAHGSLLGTAVLLWSSVMRGRSRLTGVLWLFVTALHAGALGALLALSRRPWFPGTSLADQQLAGLVMWVPAGTVLTLLALTHVGTYLRQRPADVRVVVILMTIAVTAALYGCDGRSTSIAAAVGGGNPSAGPEKLRRYGCTTCHTVPGVAGASSTVGPSLAQFGSRAYVAGAPNDPDRVVEFIVHPREVRPGTPMPDVGVADADAHDIVAYLYTLR